jgi:uncharacterized protein YacL
VFVFVSAYIGLEMARTYARMHGDTDATASLYIPCLLAGVIVALVIVSLDWFSKQKKLSTISAVVIGLIVGVWMGNKAAEVLAEMSLSKEWLPALRLTFSTVFCYLAISLILQTKDEFRFVIPYVEFAKERHGPKPLILDTSVLIDGRIADVVETSLFDSKLIIPRFVLKELHDIADSADKLRRNRGRRGLDVLDRMQKSGKANIQIIDALVPETTEVDSKLVVLAKNMDARVVTNDFNLNKVAQVQGVDVININDIANALRPVVLPGEKLQLKVIRAGEEYGQGVGYLDDGTMIVVEQGRNYIGKKVDITVTSVLQTSAGRMIFGKIVA